MPEPGTIYQGIRKLPAAHSLIVERGKPVPAPSRYWTLRFDPRPMNEADAVAVIAPKSINGTGFA